MVFNHVFWGRSWMVANPDRTAFLGDYFRVAGNSPGTWKVGDCPPAANVLFQSRKLVAEADFLEPPSPIKQPFGTAILLLCRIVSRHVEQLGILVGPLESVIEIETKLHRDWI